MHVIQVAAFYTCIDQIGPLPYPCLQCIALNKIAYSSDTNDYSQVKDLDPVKICAAAAQSTFLVAVSLLLL